MLLLTKCTEKSKHLRSPMNIGLGLPSGVRLSLQFPLAVLQTVEGGGGGKLDILSPPWPIISCKNTAIKSGL